MGRLIVIEGLDGSGKATQSGLLYDKLNSEGIPVKKVSFPDYDSNSSALIKMYLGGEFGTRPDDVNAYAASSFYAVDRFASFKKWENFYQDGGTIIADRYTTSNAIHQCAKLPRDQWDDYLSWLFDFEYRKIGIPEPDCVVYLNVDPEMSQQLLLKRYHGDNAKKDIHEKDVDYLKRSRAAAQYCALKLGWETINCCDENGGIFDVAAIHKQILEIIK